MNIGLVSTRFAGTDGVSLEAAKWAEVFAAMGHRIHWFSGRSDRPKEVSRVVPEAFFGHPEVLALDREFWSDTPPPAEALRKLEQLRGRLEEELGAFCEDFQIDLLVAENALTIPMHLSLGLALADWIERSGIACIAHHHDFHWERERFRGQSATPLLDRAFPPPNPKIAHAVIHSEAARELERRTGLRPIVVPNVMDFENVPTPPEDHLPRLRAELGFSPQDRIFLQPTRVVPRKGIELAIDLLAARNDPSDCLVISHEAGDEGLDYLNDLRRRATEGGVRMRELGDRIGPRSVPCVAKEGTASCHSLWDLYAIADFVTYPSLQEGFGNALLESFACRRPVLVNRYPVYQRDIEPHGFEVVPIDGAIGPDTLAEVDRTLEDPDHRARMVETNFRLAKAHFGYDTLRSRLEQLLVQSEGSDPSGEPESSESSESGSSTK